MEDEQNNKEKVEKKTDLDTNSNSVNDGALNSENIENEVISHEEKVEHKSIEGNFDSILNDNKDLVEEEKKNEVNPPKKEDISLSDNLKEAMSSNQIKNIIIGALVVLVIILTWLWQGSSKNNNKNVANQENKDTVVVSDKKEQGIVRIVETSDSSLGIDNNTLLAANQVGITAYFGNLQKNPSMTDCSITFPLDRVIEKKYDSELINAVKGLLEPLTADETSKGYISSVPKGTTLKYIKISNGVAEVNFGAELNKVGGSCLVSAIRSQIEKTLLQFPQVKSVRICVDGNCDQSTILQP